MTGHPVGGSVVGNEAAPAFTTRTSDGIIRLVLDLPGEPVNKITASVVAELEQLLKEVAEETSVRAAVIISGKPDNFIAGADIDQFVKLQTEEEALELVRGGQALINKIADSSKPVVAAIHGACVGGGFEAALACHYRVATDAPKTTIGLPEVQLGIIPAAGGCQRLPRLIGGRAALDIILAGKTVPAKRAFKSGMVDELVHPAILEEVAVKAAARLADGWKPKRSKGGVIGIALDRNPAGRRIVFSTARKKLQEKTGGHYPAPFAALDAVEYGLKHGITAGLDREAKHFAELAVDEVSRNLVQIFFATTALKKDPGVPQPAPKPARVRNLAIVGSGFMGSGIAGTAVLRGKVDVRLRDADLGRIGLGLSMSRKILDERLKRRRLDRFDHRRLTALLSGGIDWAGFRRADLVIEAVFEDLEVKHRVFRDLEQHTRDDCVLASNTSTIPISRIAQAVQHPERVLGMHFFSPVEKMPLLEVIKGEMTDAATVVTAVDFGQRMGKTVIVVADTPGFWVNRILSPYLNEAGHLLAEGIRIEEIDTAMKQFGFPVGPLQLLDEVGLDVAHKASDVMHDAFGDRMAPSYVVARMIDRDRKGRKSQLGFYKYEKGKRTGPDEALYALLNVEPRPVPDADVENRLLFALLNEAARAYDEGVVRAPRDADIGAVFGFGFPPFRGGPLRYIDRLGPGRVVDSLERLKHAYGERFEPAPVLRRMAQADERFHPTTRKS
jgi:3-hydroxyacyl-CoA dehydrogenase/enoyl-CoA hydratase/3-hydroxybutyryl-CoA epimerase